MNIHTPLPGFPVANNPNRNTQANIAINITFLIPNRFKKNGISNIHNISEICDNEIKALAFLAPQLLANSGISLKLLINGLAYPFVICNETPNNIEKIKKMAILRSLSNEKAFKPKASDNVFLPSALFT